MCQLELHQKQKCIKTKHSMLNYQGGRTPLLGVAVARPHLVNTRTSSSIGASSRRTPGRRTLAQSARGISCECGEFKAIEFGGDEVADVDVDQFVVLVIVLVAFAVETTNVRCETLDEPG